jgi:hypothetical protein
VEYRVKYLVIVLAGNRDRDRFRQCVLQMNDECIVGSDIQLRTGHGDYAIAGPIGGIAGEAPHHDLPAVWHRVGCHTGPKPEFRAPACAGHDDQAGHHDEPHCLINVHITHLFRF